MEDTADSMERRPFGRTEDLLPSIGQGTWGMERDRANSVRALRRGLDLGMGHIDTAEMYGRGAVEELVGEAISGRRDEVFLTTKVLPGNASSEELPRSCEASLRRLRTEWIDLFLLHWPSDHPLEETIDAFARLQQQGKIRRFGVSNFDVADLERAARIAGKGNIACNQVLYHLGERSIEFTVIPWCRTHAIPVVGYSPFGSGNFPPPSRGGRRVLESIAEAHGATPRQVALRFLLRDPLLFTIPKAGRAKHATENARAGLVRLSQDECARIDIAFPAHRRRDLAVL
jgi:diketogulonate reductase-like aldo/keto reductase